MHVYASSVQAASELSTRFFVTYPLSFIKLAIIGLSVRFVRDVARPVLFIGCFLQEVSTN